MRFLILALLLVGAGAQSFHANAQAYPSRPIRLIVGQVPGGHSDGLGRIVAQRLAEALKQPVVIENRGGAGGAIAAEAVARAPADGYTLLFAASSSVGSGPVIYKDLRYTAQDFASVGAIARVSYGIALHPSVPAKTLSELVAYAKANPGKLNYSTSGPASSSALGFEMLKRAAGIDLVAVAYKGSAAAINDFLSGQVHMMFTDLALLAPLAANGSARLLAVAGNRRASLAPDVPTVTEQGFRDISIEPWYGLAVPAGTSPDIVARLNEALRACLRSPEVREQFERLGYVAIESTPAELDAMIAREAQMIQRLLDSDSRPRR